MPNVVIGADLVVRGLGKFKGDMDQAGKSGERTRASLGRMHREGRSGFGRLTRSVGFLKRGFGSIIGSITKVTAGLVGVGAMGVKSFGDFELQMARIQTMMPEGASAMNQFGDSVLNNAVKFGQSIRDTSNAVFQSLSAGVQGNKQQMDEYSAVIGQAAAGGFTNMATVVDGLTNVMNAFGLSIEDARQVSDSFFVANRLGKTTFEELSRTVGRVAPTMKTLGGSYQELLSVVVAMSKQGVKTSEVISSLKQVLANIAKPTDDAAKAADKLSIKLGGDAIKAAGGLGNYLNILAEKTRGNVDAQTALFGSVESFNAIALLTSQKGLRDLNDALRETENAAGATEKAFGDVKDTIGFKLQQIKVGLSRAAIEIGHGLTQGLGLDKIEDIPGTIERAAGKIRASAAAFAKGFSDAFSPLWEASGFDWETFAERLGSAAGSIVTGFMKVGEIIAEVLGSEAFQVFMRAIGVTGGTAASAQTGTSKAMVGGKEVGIAAGGFMQVRNQNGLGAEITKLPGYEAYTNELAKMRVVRRFNEQRSDEMKSAGASLMVDERGATGILGVNYAADQGELFAEIQRAKVEIEGEHQQAAMKLSADQFSKNARAVLTSMNESVVAAESKRAEDERMLASQREWLTNMGSQMLNSWTINIKQDTTTNVKDKKAKGGGSFSARGRGNATVRSSAEQNYLLMEGRIVPMGDEFHYGHMISEEPTATLPSAG